MMFADRKEAGQKLAKALQAYQGQKDVVVAAVPRGGVVVGRVVADALGVALDIVVPRKIGAPWSEEYAIGAIAESGEAVWNESERDRIDASYRDDAIKKERNEAQRRLARYRQGLPPRQFKDKTVIIVDDGIATGLTMRAAVKTVKADQPKKIIVAVPVAAQDSVAVLKSEAGETVAVSVPLLFPAVGTFYREFPQVSDTEVITLLHRPAQQ